MNIVISRLYDTDNGMLYNIAWFKYWKKSVCICINWQCSRFIFHFSFVNAPLCSKLACKIHALFAFLMTPLLLIFFLLHYFSSKSKYLFLRSFKKKYLTQQLKLFTLLLTISIQHITSNVKKYIKTWMNYQITKK